MLWENFVILLNAKVQVVCKQHPVLSYRRCGKFAECQTSAVSWLQPIFTSSSAGRVGMIPKPARRELRMRIDRNRY